MKVVVQQNKSGKNEMILDTTRYYSTKRVYSRMEQFTQSMMTHKQQDESADMDR